ncbi:type VI secretion protein [Streptomyces sp. NPDC021100]|uniref:type VI secretion protein n=1 Tax=Streptomyces sp. NPDC021100 TaxID=3365114 RepID=UPI00378A0C3B
MAQGSRPPGERGTGGVPDGLLVGAFAFLLGITVLLWSATGLAGFFAHGGWPEAVTLTRTPLALRHLMSDPRDLSAAWPDTPPDELSGYGLFWGMAISEALVSVVLLVFALGTLARRRRVRRARRDAAVRAVGGGPGPAEEAPAAGPPTAVPPAPTAPTATEAPTSPEPRPSTARPAPATEPSPPEPATPTNDRPPHVPSPRSPATPPRLVYGTDRRSAAARAILEAAGPVLVTTSDPELWAETKDSRAKLGPVRVFDPGHLLDTPDRLRWNPSAGCESRTTAAARANALLAPVRPLSALDSLTAETAETLLGCWLHAAAVDGRPFRQVHRWAQGASAHEPVRILRTSPKAAAGAAGELESALTGHPERRDMAQELTARALNALSSVHIRDACNPNRSDVLALESFAAEMGTLYVVGEAIEDPRTRPGAMPLLTALAANVVERGRGVAERSPSGRLDPPLTLVLDDVAAVAPLPALPDLLEDGAELGMPTLALMRSEEQARTRWPRRTLTG